MTGIGKETGGGGKNTGRCGKCRFWSVQNKWCNYGDVMKRSRAAAGAFLLPEGGCSLFEDREGDYRTQRTIREKWAAGRTDVEAYSKARMEARKQGAEERRRVGAVARLPESVWAHVRELYSLGLTDPEIAREAGCGKNPVLTWRQRNGLESNYRKRMEGRK